VAVRDRQLRSVQPTSFYFAYSTPIAADFLYSKKAKLIVPSLEEYERKIISMPMAVNQ